MAALAKSKRFEFAPQMRAGRVRRDPNQPWFRLQADAGTPEAPRATVDVFGYIGQDFDPWTGERIGTSAETLLAQLRQIPANADIDVTVNSNGGNPFDGAAMHTFLSAHQGKVTVTVAGIAASAASLVVLAGDVIRMPSNAWLMIHNPSCGAYGEVSDLQKAIDSLMSIKDGAIATYVGGNRKGMTAEAVAAVMDAETWYTGTSALEAGWIDEILEPVAATMLVAHKDENVPLNAYGNVPAELALADAVEAAPPAPEAALVAELQAQVVEMQAREADLQARLAAAAPPVVEPTPEDAAAAERMAAEAAAAEATRAAEMQADQDVRSHARRLAVMHGLAESFDSLIAIGARTEQLTELVIRGSVARAGMTDVASHADPVVPPPAKEEPKPVIDPARYYAALNTHKRPGSK